MPEPLTLFARITPKSEHLAAARHAVLDILSVTRAEPGCRVFTLHDDPGGGGCLYLYEVWDDEAALEAHHAQPYTQAVFDHYRLWLSEPVAITRLRQIGEVSACSS
ncbi:antibiotic biosynthesis monooxygenase [Methylobacterium sp. BTF04]|uniref:putative quinol monooxygenase n=1 Tax=Methylobacterium sp. BTF04 TaxID=2708300 RepID=UPI0013D0AB79|nr:putative quinol monooxygenase [Methylobacterium sp. BTF04]NEU13645.1 antibiotic biosynthesis monooxygenase [Methylobacterium sp. BTF04]